jgi:hypothetical protein
MAVSYKTLERAGLLQVFPQLLTLETEPDSWGQTLRRRMFDQRPAPSAMDEKEQPDETKQIQKIASLYGYLFFTSSDCVDFYFSWAMGRFPAAGQRVRWMMLPSTLFTHIYSKVSRRGISFVRESRLQQIAHLG